MNNEEVILFVTKANPLLRKLSTMWTVFVRTDKSILLKGQQHMGSLAYEAIVYPFELHKSIIYSRSNSKRILIFDNVKWVIQEKKSGRILGNTARL